MTDLSKKGEKKAKKRKRKKEKEKERTGKEVVKARQMGNSFLRVKKETKKKKMFLTDLYTTFYLFLWAVAIYEHAYLTLP